jgi:sugar O-acyltransferase (sialic acid O-acetyltransferase NeuD family)
MIILVYGCAEFGQVVKNLVQNCGHEFVGFIDDYKEGDGIYNYDLADPYILREDTGIVIAVGYKDLRTRWAIYQKVKADGYKVPSLIHPKAVVDESAKIGEGAIVMAGAVVDYNAEIKDLAVLWNGVVVNHDSVIGENTFLSPSSTICGCTTIGRDCFIGAGAVVPDHVKVPDGSFVRAGSVYVPK